MKEIEEGTSARIYYHKLNGTDIAVKVLKQQISKQKVMSISKKLLCLDHKNVVKLFWFSMKPISFLFEYCSVKVSEENYVNNLQQLTAYFNENDCFHIEKRVGYCLQVANGLKYLHTNNIVHRDLKPSNVLVKGSSTDNVIIKISDFDDIAEIESTIAATMTKNNFSGMTLCYMASEIVKRTVKKPTSSSDIYSWGITAFETLSNNSAWDGILPILNDTLLLQAILNDERPDTSILEKLYPTIGMDDITNLLENSWNPLPEQRLSLNVVSL